MTAHQRKDALEPDKNRNNFKRMWKKDLQIKVYFSLCHTSSCKASIPSADIANADHA